MTEPAEKIDHPYIVSQADYCGGNPFDQRYEISGSLSRKLRSSPRHLTWRVGWRVFPSNPRASIRRALLLLWSQRSGWPGSSRELARESQRTILTHNIRHFRLLNQRYQWRRHATLRDLTFSPGTVKRSIAPSSSVFRATQRRWREKQCHLVGWITRAL